MLEIRNVSKTYKPKKGVPVKALDNISLKFHDKGMVFILGKSGSGKSTLLNVLGGLDRCDSGEIIIKGKSSKDFSQSDFDSYRNTYLGFIFQEYNILDEFTVGANIALAIELQARKATDAEINKIMSEVDLVGYGSRKPNELSGGQMQRVAIARALVKNPEIIMADEPTGALDSKTGIQVFDTLKKLSKTKLVIVVSHDREFAELYGDRVIELADGKIISDIEKYTAVSAEANEGISVVDDNIIYIKKGYKLSVEDLNLINRYLANSMDDVIISVDGKTNNQIKRFARIDDEGNRESFRPTDTKKLEKITYDNKFKLIRSKLPFKDSLKIGASGLKVKPVRLFFTIFLSFIAFALFGLADTMGSYEKINATVQSITQSNIKNITFTRCNYCDQSYYSRVNMSEDDIKALNDELGYEFKPIFNNKYSYYGDGLISLDNSFTKPSEFGNTWSGYYVQGVSGFAEFSQEELTRLGFTIKGELPDEFNEIGITKYIYDHFKTAGYRSPDGKTELNPENITSEEVIIGKELMINSKIYVITAIIDTKFNEERYAPLKATGEESIGYYLLYRELMTVMDYGYHALVYVKSGFIENEIQNNTTKGIDLESIGAYLYIDNNYYRAVARLSDLDADKIIMIDESKTTLAPNEVLINIERLLPDNLYEIPVLPEDMPVEGYNLDMYISYKFDEKIQKYAEENYQEAYANGFTPKGREDEELSEEDKIFEYYNYLYYYNPGYYLNKYGDKSGIDFDMEIKADVIRRYGFLPESPESASLNYYLPFYGKDNFKDISIVGFYLPGSSMYKAEYDWFYQISYLIIDDNFYTELAELNPGVYKAAIGAMPTDKDEIRKLVTFSYNNGSSEKGFKMENEVTFLLNQVNEFVEQTSKVFLYIGIGFAVFASLLLLNFITTSISYKKREIGILRALGARSTDVFGIFFNESLLIALINFILAFAGSLIGVIIINSFLRSEYGLLITILNFGLRQVVLMLVVSVGVAFIASFFPVYRISHKKPIDAIRNR